MSKLGTVYSEVVQSRISKSPIFVAFVIVAAVLAAFSNTFRVPFLLDDYPSIIENPSIRRLWEPGTVISPPADSPTAGRPVANLSFAVSYAISGQESWGHHILNLTVHALAALLLFGVVRRTLMLSTWHARLGGHELFLPGAIAVLWAVHPLQTQTVTYISQRTESLMALFYLLTLYCFIRGVGGRANIWHSLAVGACLLGAMSKEVFATAPVVVLLYDRTFVSGTFRAALRHRWRFYACLAATWLVIAWLLLDVRNRGVGIGLGVSSFQYALTQCKAVLLYLSLGIWPHPLVFDYGSPVLNSIGAALPYAIILAVLLAGTCWAIVRSPATGFVMAWFFVILAPASSFVPVTGATIAENRPYLPLAAVITLVVVGLQTLLGRRTAHVICLFFAAASIVSTLSRNHDYHDDIYLWTDTLAKSPAGHRAPNNLGELLVRRPGRQAEARALFETALRLKPDFAEAHSNLGELLSNQPGHQTEALTHFETALRLRPNFAEAHNNLGELLAPQPGRQMEALSHFETALRLKPEFAEAHNNLGGILSTLPGRQAEALAHYETALRLKPNFADAHNNLGLLFANWPSRQAEALAHYETALRLKPDYVTAHYNLANLLASQPGREAEALAHFEATLRLKPDYAEAHNNLGGFLAGQPGRQADALAHFETALRLLPNNPIIHFNVAEQLEKTSDRQIEALAHYATALKIDPNFSAASEGVRRLQKPER